MQSSNGRRSKILAAIEAVEDYRASRTKLDKGMGPPIIEGNNTKILKKALKLNVILQASRILYVSL
ncbi:MAG: hypothetical protein ACRD42_05395 [Nitrososphaeraceae archaeon]